MMAKRDNRPATISAEKGSALVMMIFIMVVLALLLAALAYITAQSNQNTAYQIASTRAYWAAQSGAEWGTYQIAPATGSAASQCFSPSPAYPAIGSIPGLGGCSAKVACSPSPSSSATVASTTSYQITSQGACPAGNLGADNTIMNTTRSVMVGIATTKSATGTLPRCVSCIQQYCYSQLLVCYYLNICQPLLSCINNHCSQQCSGIVGGGNGSSSTATLNYWLENP